MTLPKLVEFHHEQFAEILAGHGRQGHAKMLGIRSRLECESNAFSADAIGTAIHSFLVSDHHLFAQGLLKHSEIAVSAAVFVDHKINWLLLAVPFLSGGRQPPEQ